MALNRLPPLNLASPKSPTDSASESNDGSNNSSKMSARERRRMRISKQLQNNLNDDNNSSILSDNQTKKAQESKSNLNDGGQINAGYEIDNEDNDNSNRQNENETYQANRPPRARRSRPAKSTENSQENLNSSVENQQSSAKPTKRKATKKKYAGDYTFTPTSNPILEGLEEDIVAVDDDEVNRSATDKEQNESGDASQRENLIKSVPTDKFYLELEKKFAIQNKLLYEKKEKERLAQLFEIQLKQKEKEELKYQISTPKTALNMHKFLKVIFLFFHGINVGFQLWQVVVLYTINLNNFQLNLSVTDAQSKYVNSFNQLALFQNLSMPIHCLSYFLLTLCVIDTMDRVDLTKIKTVAYLVKCLSFQNQFWSIVSYIIALVCTLSIISIDQTTYLTLFLEKKDVFLFQTIENATNSARAVDFLKNMDVSTWKSISIVRAVFSLLAWLIFSVFVKDDQTFESLEKREFSLFDEIANQLTNEQSKQTPIQLQQQAQQSNDFKI